MAARLAYDRFNHGQGGVNASGEDESKRMEKMRESVVDLRMRKQTEHQHQQKRSLEKKEKEEKEEKEDEGREHERGICRLLVVGL